METNWFSIAVAILFIQWEWSVSNCLVSAAVRVQWIVVTINSAYSVNSPKACLFPVPTTVSNWVVAAVCLCFAEAFRGLFFLKCQVCSVWQSAMLLVMYTTFESKLKARQLCLQAQSCNTTFESALKIKVRQVCFQADLALDQLIPPPPPPSIQPHLFQVYHDANYTLFRFKYQLWKDGREGKLFF